MSKLADAHGCNFPTNGFGPHDHAEVGNGGRRLLETGTVGTRTACANDLHLDDHVLTKRATIVKHGEHHRLSCRATSGTTVTEALPAEWLAFGGGISFAAPKRSWSSTPLELTSRDRHDWPLAWGNSSNAARAAS